MAFSNQDAEPNGQESGPALKDSSKLARQQRLASALRENLYRRKQQNRERNQVPAPNKPADAQES